ncbi:MAG TPA: (2Fe-2S)-binding protein [Pseudomonadota bacterium]|nr:(2Fe-2S)-binding protein [Pseudomonadota bacterium]
MKRLQHGEPQRVQITLNGSLRSGLAEPRLLLSDFLRHTLGATGTHVGCEHGECGACTVVVDGQAVRSCLMLAVQVDGRRVQTVEGLAQEAGLTPLQIALREHYALQCGFCIPGILMSCSEMLTMRPLPSSEEIPRLLSGHLCRCTGYRGIIAAVQQEVARLKAGEPTAEGAANALEEPHV